MGADRPHYHTHKNDDDYDDFIDNESGADNGKNHHTTNLHMIHIKFVVVS